MAKQFKEQGGAATMDPESLVSLAVVCGDKAPYVARAPSHKPS